MDQTQRLRDIGEFGLIDQVRAQLGGAGHVLIGSGDDAAQVSTAAGSYLVSTDLLIEGRHFRRDWSSAYEVGRKAAAANMSDIAAMGGTANALTVGFAAPSDLETIWALDLTRGIIDEAATVGALIVGGDATAADTIVVAVTAMGEAQQVVRRTGAAAGDVVAFAGRLGWAGAGFAALSRGFRSPKKAVEAHRLPEPPYAAGPQAAAAGATAMTDVSDGLLIDVGHLAAASAVAIDIRSDRFVVGEPLTSVGQALGVDPLQFVLTGGDDYALVATFGAQVPEGWTVIGTVATGEGVTVDGAAYEESPGHEHFR